MINEKLYHNELLKHKIFIWHFSQKFHGLKKCKTKVSDGQPSMNIYFDYTPLLAWFPPSGRVEKAAEIQDNSIVDRFFLSWHELASCQGLTKKPD